jgi:Ca2+-transporting ATPase
LRFILFSGTIKALLALGLLGLVPGLGFSLEVARSVVFHFLAIAQLFFTYPARHTQLHPLFNPILQGVVLLGIATQILVGSIPAAASALGAVLLPLPLWGLILGASLLAWGFAELLNRVFWR